MLTEVNMDRHEEIKASYKSLGKGYSNMYDGIITVQGGEEFPEECRATRIDIDRKLSEILRNR